MKEGKINLNEAEANDLLKLIDVAQKALGLEASEICVHFARKIQNAFKDEEIKESPAVVDILDLEEPKKD